MKYQLRPLEASSKSQLVQLLDSIPSFDLEDRSIAIELVDFALEHPGQSDYEFILLFGDENLLFGYACFGVTPLTKGVYTLYWIAVDHEMSGSGLGSAILEAVEKQIIARKGRMIILETSSSADYALTRKFYLKNGYTIVEILRDFYQPGEDRVTFVKHFNHTGGVTGKE